MSNSDLEGSLTTGTIGEVGWGREVERINEKSSRRTTVVTRFTLVGMRCCTDLGRTTIRFSFDEVVR